jgi:diketogulonate reductase-like aldo/keto reductase
MRGIFRIIAEKEGRTITDVKHDFMKAVTTGAKIVLGIKPGERAKPGVKWFEVLRYAIKAGYKLLETNKKVPTPEEVAEATRKLMAELGVSI